ncbi:hypothetical protein L3Q82_009136 [Scortum barcoo]|uniref:Uncharacterized protein n=1 Tax=Scortum barcoo TaxID=214431 RepID=A0ACB8XBB7_9TELE|nr:hypothetical protein L3Q82_009136 [Scortum barcoo]
MLVRFCTLYHLVFCCHCQGQGQTAAHHSLCLEGDWLQSTIPPGPVYIQDLHTSRSCKLRALQSHRLSGEVSLSSACYATAHPANSDERCVPGHSMDHPPCSTGKILGRFRKKDQLAPHELPDDFDDLVDLAARIDTRLWEWEKEQRQSTQRTSNHQREIWRSWEFHQSMRSPPVSPDIWAPSAGTEKPMQLGRTKLPPDER